MPEDATNTAEATAVTAAAYLKSHPFHHESVQRWPVQGDLRVRLSLTAALPPADVTSSIQAIVLGDGELRGQVLFLWPHNRGGDIAHVLIGGRQDPGETHHQTAVREVAEETGWLVTPLHMVGFRHFHHL
ncbi:MAG TPA: NUDIX domain-containing protein, partial [Candidatus Methylacidiphilales bacterium]|nr:NUDIX domain-containing protein [Candidatus Methylacidiphilales bacterium]